MMQMLINLLNYGWLILTTAATTKCRINWGIARNAIQSKIIEIRDLKHQKSMIVIVIMILIVTMMRIITMIVMMVIMMMVMIMII
jgi:hypothetical protein